MHGALRSATALLGVCSRVGEPRSSGDGPQQQLRKRAFSEGLPSGAPNPPTPASSPKSGSARSPAGKVLCSVHSWCACAHCPRIKPCAARALSLPFSGPHPIVLWTRQDIGFDGYRRGLCLRQSPRETPFAACSPIKALGVGAACACWPTSLPGPSGVAALLQAP